MHKRGERSKPVISQWKVDGVYECISFAKECECEEDIALKIRAGGKIAIRIDGNPHYADTKDGMFPLGKGKHYVCVDVFCENGFPCLYVEGGPFDSDGSWKTNCGDTSGCRQIMADFMNQSQDRICSPYPCGSFILR